MNGTNINIFNNIRNIFDNIRNIIKAERIRRVLVLLIKASFF